MDSNYLSLPSGRIIQIDDINDVKNDDCVVIRAHGEPQETFKYLEENNINYIEDSTLNLEEYVR